jgi:hypothetical protein
MFDPTSRYVNVPTTTETFTLPDGEQRSIAYLQRRFIPDLSAQPIIAEHTVIQGERLDNLTAAYLNDPQQFWRICDSNAARHPLDLMESGRRIVVRLPKP